MKRIYSINSNSLKKKLDEDGQSYKSIAEKLAVHPRTISRWVNGHVSGATRKQIQKLAQCLNCSFSDLVIEDSEKEITAHEKNALFKKIKDGDLEQIFGKEHSWDSLILILKLYLGTETSEIEKAELFLAITNAYIKQQKFSKAQSYARKAIYFAEKTKDVDVIARALINLGSSYDGLGKVDQAIEYYRRCYELPVSQWEIKSNCLHRLAFAYYALGETALSFDLLKREFDALKRNYDPKSKLIIRMCFHLANYAMELGQYKYSEELFKSYLTIAREVAPFLYYEALCSLCHLQILKQDSKGALHFWEQVKEVHERYQFPKDACFYGTEARMFIFSGSHEKAKESLMMRLKVTVPLLKPWVYADYIRVAHLEKSDKRKSHFYQKAEAILLSYNAKRRIRMLKQVFQGSDESACFF